VLAAPPSNDNFAAAEVLSGTNVSVTGTNVDATLELPDEPNTVAGQPALASVWYSWTAPASQVVVIDLAGSDADVLARVKQAMGL